MKLFQIEEPDGSPTDAAEGSGAAVGIDIAPGGIGRVAIAVGGNGEILPDADGERTLRARDRTDLLLGLRSRGCSGLTYTLEYADEKGKLDELVQDKGVTVLIDPKASMFIIGTEMDYVEDKLQSGFTFRNPNEKGRCGCGESFHV